MAPTKKRGKNADYCRAYRKEKLKNTAEKTERENNFNEITENMFPTLLNMKNSRGEIVKKK